MSDRPIFPGTIQTATLDIENGDSTGEQDLLTAGTDGSRINSISAISDDTADVILSIFYNDGSTSFRIGSITVPTLSGTDGETPSVSLLNVTDLPFLGADLSLYILGGKKITIAAQTAVTAAKKVTLVATYGDY